MTPFGNQNQVVATTRLMNPFAQRFFALTKTINMCRIHTVPTRLEKSIEQLRGALIRLWCEGTCSCSQSDNRNRLFELSNLEISHRHFITFRKRAYASSQSEICFGS